jgi:hypothetical protein
MPDPGYFKSSLAFDFGAKSGRVVRGHLRSGIFLTAFMCNARRRTDTDFSVRTDINLYRLKGVSKTISSTLQSALLFHNVGEIIRRDTRYDRKRNTILGGHDCVVVPMRCLFCSECYGPPEEGLRKSAEQRPAPRVVALDERQYHSGRHQA